MSGTDDKKPVTTDVMKAYISVLEKQVQQMTLVVTTLEELNEKLGKVEGHFHNGFRSEITSHVSNEVGNVIEKLEKVLTTVYISKELTEQTITTAQSTKDSVGSALSAIKDKLNDIRASIKIDRAIHIVSWSSIVVTVLVKLFFKI